MIPEVVCESYLGIGYVEGAERVSQGEWLKAAILFGPMVDEVSGAARVCNGPAREIGALFPFQAVVLKRMRKHYPESESARVEEEATYRGFYSIALRGLGLEQEADLELSRIAEIKFDGDLEKARQYIAELHRLSVSGRDAEPSMIGDVVEN